MNGGCENVPHCIHSILSMTKTNYAAKIPSQTCFEDLFCRLIAHKCYISSFNFFHLVQTRVLWLLATWRPKKKILTLPVQFSPPHAGNGQIPHSPGTEDSQMPGLCPGRRDVEVSILSAHNPNLTLIFL